MKVRINNREVTITDATVSGMGYTDICYRNFKGEGSDYNAEGKRNFNVIFRDTDDIKELQELGFRLKPKSNEDGAYTLKVHVNFASKYPPEVYYILGKSRKEIGENDAFILDKKNGTVDLRFVGSKSSKARDNYLNAYLDTLYFVAEQDVLFDKWNSEDDEDNPF
jgi:hypothetical protein